MQIGIDSFAALVPDPITGHIVTAQERIAHLLEEIELADQVGLDVFGIGEHHRSEYLDSAPAVILAAAAARTKTIRLTSAVTVLSAADPVRVFQEFATLDLISNGRAEIVAGRGSFIESFPLFGLKLEDYDSLFAEKLDLLLTIRETTNVTLVRQASPRSHRTRRLPSPPAKPASHLARSRRHTRILRPRRRPRSTAHGRHHRRRTPPLPSPHRPLPRSRKTRRSRPRRSSKSASTPSATSPTPTKQASDDFFPGYAEAFTEDRQRTRLASRHAQPVRSPPPPHRRTHGQRPRNRRREDSSK